MELANPGVGMAGRVQLFGKGQVLVSHITGNLHLADGVHGKPYRIGVDHLLHIGPVGLRNLDIGDFFQLVCGSNGNKFVPRQNHFLNGHQQHVRQLDTFY